MKYFKLLSAIFLFLINSISTNAQTVTITQPNGGEILYACQTYTVMWTQTGSPSNYWNIDYSLDGGTIWTSVASNYLSTNGQFIWTVPSVQSNTVLMRVRDALNATTSDQSDAYFTINIPIILTSPNGGEVLQGGNVHIITWTATGTTNTYTIRYSTDNGTSWTTIVSNYFTTTATYAWTIPNTPSTQCLVQVYDNIAFCTRDQSNAVFTIIPTPAQLLTPNGTASDTLKVNCTYNITWNTATFFSTVNLYYSTNNGSTWTSIVTGTANDGTHNWTIPNAPSTQCLVKAANSADVNLFDVSDNTFTIHPPIELITPNGGENFVGGCTVYPITWKKNNCIGNYTIEYSNNSGSTWNTLVTTVTNNASSLYQTYNWTTPNLSSSTYRIRVKASSYPTTMFDDSNADFTLTPIVQDITVTAPNGGEVITGGTNYTITWTALPSSSGAYSIDYYDGTSWTSVASNITGNSYNWSVPNSPPTRTNCLIKVRDYNVSCKSDQSDANFTVTASGPQLLTPNGTASDTLKVNCTYNITWNTATFFSTVNLYYSTNNGSTWTSIVTGTANDG
ncbi:MAG: hypothetical protein J0L87_10270, partial [Bacteroidetes bacterium]|nr:hypothetical protein [Bacteroidota bacterium]